MICQRPANKARPLLWEYVGGKVKHGETKEATLVHEYPDITIHLTLFNASISGGEITSLEHNDFRWILPSEISNFEFCPADESINAFIRETYDKTSQNQKHEG